MSDPADSKRNGEPSASVVAARRFLESGNDYHKPFLDRWIPSTGRVMDVGCALGRVAHSYSTPGRRVVGLDYDRESVRLANAGTFGLFVAGDAFNLPLQAESLVAYVGMGIIELDTMGPIHALQEANRVLVPGGILYLSLTYQNIVRRILGLNTRWHGRGVRTFRLDEVTPLLRTAGFETRLVRRSSLAWGLGPCRGLASLFRAALLREDETAVSYRLLYPLVREFANSLLVVGVKVGPGVHTAP